MALNIGQDFKKRWLATPEAVRQVYQDELQRVCELLKPDTNLQTWQALDQRAQQHARQQIDTAYAELKAELIEQARIRRQQALEQSLAQKRAAQAAYAAQLHEDEFRQYAAQEDQLQSLNQQLAQDTLDYVSRYHKNPDLPGVDYAQKYFLKIRDAELLSELESFRLRLELEADSQIEQAVGAFRATLQAAAREEIEYMLNNSRWGQKTAD